MFNYKDHAVKQRRLQGDIDMVEQQIRNLNNINNIKRRNFKKEDEKLNGKPDSPFYGLRHKSKFQILDKYISDKYDVCPDITDRIYECLKKKLINDNQKRIDKTEFLRRRRELYLNNSCHYGSKIERLFKVNNYIDLGNIQLRVNRLGRWRMNPASYRRFKIGTTKYDFTKDELMKMCDKSCIKYSKSWNKIKLFNLLLE
tara:strand:+ start:266 stop:865 length:600 start_codon:yes stop_codon:yes gene_type:complete